MGQYVEVITYKGKEIVYLNMEGLDEENQLKAIDEADRLFNSKNNILNITNLGNTTTTPVIKDKAKALHEKHQTRIKAEALIGLEGVKRIIAQGLNKNMYFAKSLDEAKEWLVSQ